MSVWIQKHIRGEKIVLVHYPPAQVYQSSKMLGSLWFEIEAASWIVQGLLEVSLLGLCSSVLDVLIIWGNDMEL